MTLKLNFKTSLAVLLCIASLTTLAACAKQSEKQPKSNSQAQTETTKTIHGIQIQDVVVGDGPEAKKGDTVSVNYLGTLAKTGEKFDSSYDRNQPFTFKLGSGQVIEGWDKGIVGMKEGGKRILIIPPDKAYGEAGYPPVIPPSSTLKFEVELLEVQ